MVHRRTLLPASIAASLLSAAVSAQDLAEPSPADERYRFAAEAFKACLMAMPDFAAAPENFQAAGYTTATDDPLVFARPEWGYAGLGVIGVRSTNGEVETVPIMGCLVYAEGTDPSVMVASVDQEVRVLFPAALQQSSGDDFYWSNVQSDGQSFLAIVAPKFAGPYAGHTLAMIVPH